MDSGNSEIGKSPSPDPMSRDGEPLHTIPGSSKETHHTQDSKCIQIITCSGPAANSLCKDDPHHRKLAIGSIICGLTCIGIVALINSVKAKEARNKERAQHYSKKARKYGIISIVLWAVILILFPVLVVFSSYLLTLLD